jgi:MFS transporter, DHA1 family, multidrug resistance protein
MPVVPLLPRSPRGLYRGLPREVAILSAVSFTVALGYGIVAPSIPAFARQFGVSDAAAASVISAFALMRVVGALPAGRLVDRFGERRIMAVGIAIVAVSSVLAGFSGSFGQLIVLRGIGGLGSAMFGVSAQTLLLRTVPAEQRGQASGLYAGGFLLGSISGPTIGGLVAAWSLRAPFFIYGAMLIIPVGIAYLVLRDRSQRAGSDQPAAADQGVLDQWELAADRVGGSQVAAGEVPGHGAEQEPEPEPAAGPGPRFGATLAEIGQNLRNRAYRAAAAANLADGFAVLGVRSAIVPLFVHYELHRSPTWTGIGFGVVAALNAATLLPAGRIADTLGRRPVIVTGCFMSAAGMVSLAFIPGLGGYLAAMAILGVGSGLLDVAPSAMIGDLLTSSKSDAANRRPATADGPGDSGKPGSAAQPGSAVQPGDDGQPDRAGPDPDAGGVGAARGGRRRRVGGRAGAGGRPGGSLVASYQMAGDIGAVTGPVAVGFLVDSVSYDAAFLLAAAVLAAAACAGLAAQETKIKSPPG